MHSLKNHLAYTETELSPAFHDLDPLNIVWHGNYVKYLEIARCALLAKINYDYPQMQESGYIWPVVDVRLKYVRPLVYGKAVVISCAVVEWEHRLKISYRMCDKTTGQLLHKAHTVQVAIDAKTQEMCYQTPTVLARCLGLDKV
ncbi:MAG: acyl-CoA thioesterase [Formosimonas sp.]|jgi:acyl-CoA thioester hydrolase